MKFSVTFFASEDTSTMIKRRCVGLNLVDWARAELESDVEVEKFENFVTAKCCDVTLVVSEEVARESGLFAISDTTRVRVATGSMDMFYSMEVVTYSKGEREDGVCVGFCYSLDEERVLNYWKLLNYPLAIK